MTVQIDMVVWPLAAHQCGRPSDHPRDVSSS